MKRSCGAGAALLLVLAACTAKEPPPAVFGGTGAVVVPQEQPLTDAAVTPSGPCGAGAPPSDTALFDDFEDGDGKIFKGYRREGWWFAASDKTQGATQSPQGEFRPERLPSNATGTIENVFAAHLTAAGHTDWGVIWGVGLYHANEGVRCPLNLSAFGGMKLRAKGRGALRLNFGMPETLGDEGGGTCKDRCWDTHGKTLFLTDDWQEYVVTWDRLQQEGWGAEVRFDEKRVIQIAFAARPKDLPVDAWLDDLTFVPRGVAPHASAGPPSP